MEILSDRSRQPDMAGDYEKSIGGQKASQCEGYAQQQTPVWEDHTTAPTNEEISETKIEDCVKALSA